MAKNTEKSTDKRLKNLKPAWKEGDPSPNPNGRPKGQRNYATIRREAIIAIGKQNGKTPEEIEEMLVAKGVSEALKGDYRFYKDDLDRLLGTAIQKSETTVIPQPLDDYKPNEIHKDNSLPEDKIFGEADKDNTGGI